MNSENDQTDLSGYLSKHIAAESMGASGVPILLLACMDSRYPHRIINTMDSLGWRGKYDQLILAGASLGVVHKPEWQVTFLDQLGFAIEHHHVSQVFILDHRDCGAYKHFLHVTPDDPAKERQAHLDVSKAAVQVIAGKFPRLEGQVRCLLLPIETVDELIVS
ncbi:MAG: carbonic anhydrase [Pyrinomonadaceae bacterium]